MTNINKQSISNAHYIHIEEESKLDVPCGIIQWKGTDVCMDCHCKCGAHFHFDDSFLYDIACPKCNQVFSVGYYVKLIPITDPEELEYVMGTGSGIKTTVEYRDDNETIVLEYGDSNGTNI